MTAQIEETVLLTPHCDECGVAGGPRVDRLDAEQWANDHDREFHAGADPEGEDA